ncbi:MAG: NnrS family protein [Epsilonproteobacteria bacterium]|nr:NnrS family protein [Campylobacterota bacterium]
MRFTNEKTKNSFWQILFAHPHRLFFGSSLIWGIVLMGLSLCSFVGYPIDFSIIHGYGMLYGVFVNAFLGFLSTVIPRYTQSIEIPKKLFHSFWLLYQIGLILWFSGFIFIGQLFSAIALMTAGFVYYQTVRIGRYPKEADSLWLVGLVFISGVLVAANLFLPFSLSWTAIWVTILPITFTVAQRMIPFFFAGYFGSFYHKSEWVVPFFVLGSWGIALGGESSPLTSMISFILFLGISYFLWLLDIYRKAPGILRILMLGFLWLPIGLFTIGVESFFELPSFKMGLHILLLGFVFTLLIGFGTRVLLGHSGQQIHADRITIIVFGITQILVIVRLIASLLYIWNQPLFVGFIDLGFVVFIIMMVMWGIRYRKAIF